MVACTAYIFLILLNLFLVNCYNSAIVMWLRMVFIQVSVACKFVCTKSTLLIAILKFDFLYL